jgi:DNA polymerase-3 subunit beta
MDLLIQRDELTKALARVQNVVERRTTQPILSAVLISASRDGLRMTATDTEVAFIGEVAANVTTPGEVAVDAGNFFQVIRTLPETVVRLSLGAGHRLEVQSGRAVFRLPGLPASDYPALPAFDARGTIRLAEADLRRLVDHTSFAVLQDDQRYGLNGTHLEERPGPLLRMVATDGHRLSASEASFTGKLSLPSRMLVPRKALAVLRKLLEGEEEIEVAFGDGAILITRAGQTFWFRLLDGEFPDYQAVVPSEGRHKAMLRRSDLNATLRRVGVLVQDKARPVRFGFREGELEVHVQNAERGEVKEVLPCEFEGEPIVVGFNTRYLQEILNVMAGDRVQLDMAHPLGPCLVRDPDEARAFFVVMPMRID